MSPNRPSLMEARLDPFPTNAVIRASSTGACLPIMMYDLQSSTSGLSTSVEATGSAYPFLGRAEPSVRAAGAPAPAPARASPCRRATIGAVGWSLGIVTSPIEVVGVKRQETDSASAKHDSTRIDQMVSWFHEESRPPGYGLCRGSVQDPERCLERHDVPACRHYGPATPKAADGGATATAERARSPARPRACGAGAASRFAGQSPATPRDPRGSGRTAPGPGRGRAQPR